ncbi:DNA polymerase III subunit alpha [Ureaplasma miroungigenitalium]|uniref:DNA-directed DNA polymerase n=1 Tax=Ureaplasma miroungigenitalium TaxID=1042321 RepID=A0ABT3BMX2_9BACT|nr:DNA polymerase III subunit alpha [Ureaplasma miroungigenitalium]MCV3728600.1 DNA polymerase III subunit alpha [Ureaplasma miroungigenitalium]MCV3734393.1 DNA polymerase III subunit alpha [Ureaplasma miroungigenitalium]
MKLANLNAHSYYSLLSSTISVEDLVLFAQENQMTHVCLTDLNNMYGAIEFYDLAVKAHLQPVLGIEINYKNNQIIVIAKNYQGYLQLMQISSHVMLEEDFDLQINDDIFIIRKKGDLNYTHANFYVADDLSASNYIACHSAYFQEEKDFLAYTGLLAIKNNTLLEKIQPEVQNSDAYLYNEELLISNYLPTGIENLKQLLKQVDLVIPNLPMNIPVFQADKKITSASLLHKMCLDGLMKRIGVDHPQIDLYRQRLDYELDVISSKKFEDYFLIVADFINYAKDHDILIGPGRGSAAGSLVAYCMEITDADPIKYNLLFERFLNPKRKTMPDIDTDIMDRKRDDVLEYIFNKYTNEHTAYIITFQRIKIKTAIRDTGRILEINLKTINEICKKIDQLKDPNDLQEITSKLHEYDERHPQLFKLAFKLINIPRNVGTHAAGIILSNSPLRTRIPLQKGMNDRYLSQYSMEYLERFGLIKMDLLGLTNLTFLYDIQKLLITNYNEHIDLLNINEHDLNVLHDLGQGKTLGIFQLESPAMTNLVKKINPQSIEDISIASALLRPGAQEQIYQYLKNRKEPHKIFYENMDIKTILEPTHGIIVYQEQVIQLVQLIARFDAANADLFRRAISKKDNEQLLALQSDFMKNAEANGYSKQQAQKWYDYIMRFGNYGFNHSHSLAYSLISYWLAYLKRHYPLEFFVSLLNTQGNNKNKILNYFQEAQTYRIKIKPIDICLSQVDFSINVHDKSIYFGLQSIKGFGSETCQKIIQADRNTKNYWDCFVNLKANKVTLANMIVLISLGAFDRFGISRKFLIANLEKNFTVLELIKDGFFSFEKQLAEEEFNLASNQEFVSFEKEYLGFAWKDLAIQTTPLLLNQFIQVEVVGCEWRTNAKKQNYAIVFIKYNEQVFNCYCRLKVDWQKDQFYNVIIVQHQTYYIIDKIQKEE